MDRYGLLKYMTQLSNVCGAYSINNQILFFGGHDSHFDDLTPSYIEKLHIHPFVLKVGKYGNNRPNENGPNIQRKYLYNGAISSRTMMYSKIVFYLPTWTQYWWKCKKPLRCKLPTSLEKYS